MFLLRTEMLELSNNNNFIGDYIHLFFLATRKHRDKSEALLYIVAIII